MVRWLLVVFITLRLLLGFNPRNYPIQLVSASVPGRRGPTRCTPCRGRARQGTFHAKTTPPVPQSYHHAVAAVKNAAHEPTTCREHYSISNELQQVAVGVADIVADASGRPTVSAPDALYRSFDDLRAG